MRELRPSVPRFASVDGPRGVVLDEPRAELPSVEQLDLPHLEETASYADIFMTSDRRLRAFARGVPQLRCKVVSNMTQATRVEAATPKQTRARGV